MSEQHPSDIPAGSEGLRSRVTLRRSESGSAATGSFFEQIGGHETFEKLVRAFYDGVQGDPVLWPMYPADDLEGAIQRLTMFLEQYWGGPGTYSEQRGHPRLRMRHAGFRVGPDARDRWLKHMRAALDTLELSPLDDATFWSYLDRAAHSLLNTFDD
ncbi:globin [Salinibacterium sp. SYSU T00001]|uniref:globin n=1 Tax=Homoserinimonas sedimenticola TaxID=2986805 RepID=UPI002235E21C|nr:globin [Salinibacterium sedimenticola]MCW4384703.1 globin [Salinibacterium sedimenticola]